MTKKKAKAWQMLGIDPGQIEGMINKGNIFEALSSIDQRSRGLNRVNRLNAFNALFNMRGQRAMVNAFMGGDKSLGDIQKEIEGGVRGDVSIKQSQKMMNDLEGDFKFWSNAMKEFKIAFTKAIEPGLRVGIKMATGILRVVSKVVETPVGKFFASLIAVTIPLVGILFAFRAAVLTATLALRTLGMAGEVGGTRSMVAGLLGNFGGMITGKRGMSGVGVNKAGRFFVQAGQTVTHNGKLYKAGQLLPKAFSAGGMRTGFNLGGAIGNFFGMGSLAASSAGTSGAILGTLGKLGGWAVKLGGFALRWLPVVGWIWTIVELLQGIFGNSEEEKREKRGEYSETAIYMRNMNDYIANQEISRGTGYTQYISKLSRFKTDPGSMAPNIPGMQQTINLHIDGVKTLTKKIDQMNALRSASSSDFNFTY
jgi:hypothetical protein